VNVLLAKNKKIKIKIKKIKKETAEAEEEGVSSKGGEKRGVSHIHTGVHMHTFQDTALGHSFTGRR